MFFFNDSVSRTNVCTFTDSQTTVPSERVDKRELGTICNCPVLPPVRGDAHRSSLFCLSRPIPGVNLQQHFPFQLKYRTSQRDFPRWKFSSVTPCADEVRSMPWRGPVCVLSEKFSPDPALELFRTSTRRVSRGRGRDGNYRFGTQIGKSNLKKCALREALRYSPTIRPRRCIPEENPRAYPTRTEGLHPPRANFFPIAQSTLPHRQREDPSHIRAHYGPQPDAKRCRQPGARIK